MKVVFGPGTFVNEAAEQIDEQLTAQTKQAEAAGQAGRAGRYAEPRWRAGSAPPKPQTLGKQASKITLARFQEGLATLALQYGLTSQPSLDDPNFVSTLVFDSDQARRHAQAALRLPVPEPRTRRWCRCG